MPKSGSVRTHGDRLHRQPLPGGWYLSAFQSPQGALVNLPKPAPLEPAPLPATMDESHGGLLGLAYLRDKVTAPPGHVEPPSTVPHIPEGPAREIGPVLPDNPALQLPDPLSMTTGTLSAI